MKDLRDLLPADMITPEGNVIVSDRRAAQMADDPVPTPEELAEAEAEIEAILRESRQRTLA
jgi:hypothetical protein